MLIKDSERLGKALSQPLSDSQREIWYAAQLGDAACAAFNQSTVLELKGELDTGALSDALDALVAAHDALRTTFSPLGDEQRVHADLPLLCPVVDLSELERSAQVQAVQKRLRSEAQTPFDLTKGPMIRGVLIKLALAKHLLVLTAHHLICDGTSLHLLVEQLAEGYSLRKRRGDGTLADALTGQFSQFIAEQLGAASKRADAEKYWLAQFEKPAPFLELPLDHPRPNKRTFNGAGGWLKLDPALSQDFKRVAVKHRCTLFAASLAAFYVLLHRLSGQTDLVLGVPMSARSLEGSHEIIGHCVNFLPLRLSVAGNPTFAEHLTNVRRMLLDALEHVNYNFGSLIQKLNLPRHPTRAPLVSTMFNVDHLRKKVELDGLEVELTPNPFCLANFDFSLSIEDHQGVLEARCLYSADMLEPDTVTRWLRHLETLMRSIVATPECRIGELALLSAAEQKKLVACSGTEEHLIHDLLPEELASLPPGTPELEMYVLDCYGQFAAPGVGGELCIGGLPVANSTTWAKDNLVNSPYAEHRGKLFLRTYYKAKYLANGEIEILDAIQLRETQPLPVTPIAEEPQSGVQEKLTEIWRDVMRLDVIAAGDDFFDLGGHSLLMTQIMGRVRAVFGVQVSLRDFFEAPTIAELTRVIEERIMAEVQQMADGDAERLAAEAVALSG